MLYVALLLARPRRALCARRDLLIENLALPQQLAVYTRQGRRPQLRHADRRFWSLLARSWSEWRSTLVLVQPDTVVRWHRTPWQRYWGVHRGGGNDLAADREPAACAERDRDTRRRRAL